MRQWLSTDYFFSAIEDNGVVCYCFLYGFEFHVVFLFFKRKDHFYTSIICLFTIFFLFCITGFCNNQNVSTIVGQTADEGVHRTLLFESKTDGGVGVV